jgi:cell division control protein 45
VSLSAGEDSSSGDEEAKEGEGGGKGEDEVSSEGSDDSDDDNVVGGGRLRRKKRKRPLREERVKSGSGSGSGSEDEGNGKRAREKKLPRREAGDVGAAADRRRARERAKRQAARVRHERKKVWKTYYEGDYFGLPAAYMLHELVFKLNKERNDLLWLAIVGVTDKWLRGKLDDEQYEECYNELQQVRLWD